MKKITDLSLFRTKAYLNGTWRDADSGATITVSDPATGLDIGTIPNMGAAETTKAIEAAEKAFPAWAALPAKERSKILRKWFDLINEHLEELALIMTIEQGKPLAESRGEIHYGAAFVEFYAEEAKRVYGDIIPSNMVDKRFLVIKQPVGVVGAITPWNFPHAMITRKASPALAAGCPVIIKPSEFTPYSALALAELAERAGFPKGVFNIITGNAVEIGKVLTSHETVRKISFTGSTAVGKLLMAQSAAHVQKISLELGGNAPFIVFDDADLDQAVIGLLSCKYRNMGQTCVCANRIFVQESVYNAFVEKFLAETKKLQIGNGQIETVKIGPLINEKGVEKVESLLKDAVSKGAKIIHGGERSPEGPLFFQPTLLTDVDDTMDMSCNEIFGPVSSFYKFKTDDEVIARSNNTNYGLASYFYSQNIKRVFKVAEKLEYGMVGINTGLVSTEMAPFGGVKESGIGREGSKYGIDEYLEIKYLSMGGFDH
ncbi:MAG: NAD-dependent succinate-semialdehyde dehydrogenase [Alphaproteobacteria bacterium]|nr:NAD-dependent succinate-semialdehyde dehydrogenase [Alphaproteobacteria bacterium]